MDSGASASYVCLEVAKKLKVKINRTLGGSEVEYPDIGGKTLDLVLEVLPGLKETIIPGNDTLIDNKIDLLYSTLEVIIRDTRIPFTSKLRSELNSIKNLVELKKEFQIRRCILQIGWQK